MREIYRRGTTFYEVLHRAMQTSLASDGVPAIVYREVFQISLATSFPGVPRPLELKTRRDAKVYVMDSYDFARAFEPIGEFDVRP